MRVKKIEISSETLLEALKPLFAEALPTDVSVQDVYLRQSNGQVGILLRSEDNSFPLVEAGDLVYYAPRIELKPMDVTITPGGVTLSTSGDGKNSKKEPSGK